MTAHKSPDEPDDVHVLVDVAALRTLFDPLRLRIMGAIRTPRTAKEIAAALGVEPNKLYYHLRRLQEHGLVSVDGRGAGAERRFVATAKRVAIDPALQPSAVEASGFVGALFGEAQRQIEGLIVDRRPGEDGTGGTVSISQVAATLSPAKLARYQERLRKLVSDFDAEPVSTSKAAVEHSLLVALFATPSSS